MSAQDEIPSWPDGQPAGPAPRWYEDCFRAALRRVAATLNRHERYPLCREISLKSSDTALATRFVKRAWDKEIANFHRVSDDVHAQDDEYRAEQFFYSDTRFRAEANVRRAQFNVPQTFLDWSYRRLHRPRETARALGLEDFHGDADAPAFVSNCATNYLVKNFWHNFVHRWIQGIGSHNYGEFGGPAREDSDFDADHVANLLLVHSYGVPVLCRGLAPPETTARILSLFARNRCNLVFAERALHRQTDRTSMSVDERWSELEWRFCRAVANTVSADLIAHGLATPSVRVFLGGEVRVGTRQQKASRWRDGNVILDIGGWRLNTEAAPYVPDDELRAEMSNADVPSARIAKMRELRAARLEEIAIDARKSYRRRLNQDPALRDSVSLGLEALGERISISLN
jgi:hypothetical protein